MEYIIIKKKIKNAYIQIKDGHIYVRVPLKMKDSDISKMLLEKKNWIEKQLNKQETKEKEEKSYFVLLGETYPITVNKADNEYIELTEKCVNVYLNNESEEKKEELIKQLYKKCAQKQYIKSTQKMMSFTGLEPSSWKIRDIKYAWGSCSSKKNITLSLNLIKKREELIEYVILHELCHLKHMNHSKEFWKMVERYMPEYKLYRKELKS